MKTRKILSILLAICMLASAFTAIPVFAEAQTKHLVDNCADFSMVSDRTTYWQTENNPDLGNIFTKTTTDGGIFLTYHVNGNAKAVNIDAFQLKDHDTAVEKYLKLSVSKDNKTFVPIEKSLGTITTVEANNSWQAVQVSAAIDGEYSYVRIELDAYADEPNWQLALGKIDITYDYELIPVDVVSDSLENIVNNYEHSDGLIIDGTNAYLGFWAHKNGNNDAQYITYYVKSMNSLQITVPFLTNYPELVNAISAEWSTDNKTWEAITLEKGASNFACEGWSTVVLSADKMKKVTGFLKINIGVLVYNNGADAVANCYGVGVSGVLTTVYDAEAESKFPETVNDPLDNFLNIYKKSTNLQVDGSNVNLGNWVNKTADSTEYLIYRVNSIGKLQIAVPFLANHDKLLEGIKAYWTEDIENPNWEEISLKTGTINNVGGWQTTILSARNLKKAKGYLKVEIGELYYNNGDKADIWAAGISAVVTEAYNPALDDVFPNEINDGLESFDNAYANSDGIQIDTTNKYIGYWANKKGNNDVQSITYRVNSIKTLQINVPYLTAYPKLTESVHAYWSADNSESSWEEISLTTGEPTNIENTNFAFVFKEARKLSYGKGYLKVQIENIDFGADFDLVENCWAVGINAIVTTPYDPNAIDVDMAATLSYDTASKSVKISTDYDLKQAGFENITAHFKINEEEFEIKEFEINEESISTFVLDKEIELNIGVTIKGWISLSYEESAYASNISTVEFDEYFDANGDGNINIIDLVRLKKAIIGDATIKEGVCDFDGKGTLDATDVVFLVRALLKSF